MAFFARPNLDNTQFKQLKGGEPLTLSGQTQIATTSGLTLIGDGGTYIPVIATGATNNYVLTYDGIEQVIKLKQSSASGGTGIYDGASPTTCTVGGLTAGTSIFNDPIVDIIQCMVAPTIPPVIVEPSISVVCAVPQVYLYEVGTTLSLSASTSFDAGCIDPLYDSGGTVQCVGRSCGVSGYTFCFGGLPIGTVTTSVTPFTYSLGSQTISYGRPQNEIAGVVCYCGGEQPYMSDCTTTFDTPLSAGNVASARCINGIYPWYWGTFTCSAAAGVGRPSACCIKDIVTGGTEGSDYCKIVGCSTATLNVVFNSTPDDYIWFATPVNGSVVKTCWYVDATNKGIIGGAVSAGGNLFPAPDTSITDMCSCDGLWSDETYQIYVSNYQSCATLNMELRNS